MTDVIVTSDDKRMAVLMDESVLAELFKQLSNYRKITDSFGLSDEQAKHENAGDWVIDCIRQYQTSFSITKSMGMLKNDNQRIENYHAKEAGLPEKNPLLRRDEIG